jgi:ketosteroid isomerase-like protein
MGQVRGRERVREYLDTFKRAMPDARAIVEQVVEPGGTAAARDASPAPTLAHSRPRGQRRTDRAAVHLRFADVSRVRDGRIAAYDTYYDQLATQPARVDGYAAWTGPV